MLLPITAGLLDDPDKPYRNRCDFTTGRSMN